MSIRKVMAEGAARYFLAWDRENGGAADALLRSGGVVYSGRFHAGSIPGMMVDFWVLVAVETFVGNFASSMSLNVCRIRIYTGSSCAGWPDEILAQLTPRPSGGCPMTD